MEYKVIALSVGGKGNKIYSSGDTVKDENFDKGRAKELVEQGFLKPLEEKETEKKADKKADKSGSKK